ncbi:MAG: class D sortase [Acidobacteriota bacterium]|nr:class D sortase [Acidobacteriota bacterium]
MARVAKIFASWLFLISGCYFVVNGGLEYYEAHKTQSEVAAFWKDDAPAPNTPDVALQEHKSAHPPTLAYPYRGKPVARLMIPRLETNLFVLEGTDQRTLRLAPGHMEGTAMPGADGNCVIAGHRDTHFRVLQNIRKGDEIVLESDGSPHRYRVSGLSVISPNNTKCLDNTKEAVLNLITCYPFHYVGSAPKRFVVHAGLETTVGSGI